MTENQEQELEALKPGVLAELTALSGRPSVLLELRGAEGWLLFTTIQLALRHPGNNGPTSAGMRRAADRLLASLRPGPALSRLAELGWDEQYDVEGGDVEGDS